MGVVLPPAKPPPAKPEPAEPEPAEPEPAEPGPEAGAPVADNDAATVADALTAALGLDVVILASRFTCSPLVLDFGTSTAACSSKTWPLPSELSLQVVVWPLGHTTKWGVALAGLLVRVTVTPLAFAPEEESHIAKFAVPPGFTLALPEKTLTLSHNFTDVGPATMNAAVWIAARCDDEPVGVDPADDDDDGEEDGDDEDFDGDADFAGAAEDLDGDGDADFAGAAEDFDGDGDADFAGAGEDFDGGGLAGIVAVTHDCVAASRAAADCAAIRVAASGRDETVPAVPNAVVVITAPTTHTPVATPARADPYLRTLTRLTPFLRSSVEGSSFTRGYCHTMRYLVSCPSCRALAGQSSQPPRPSPRARAAIVAWGKGTNVRSAPCP
jgi:hypothetical protein